MASRAEYPISRGLARNLLCHKAGLHLLGACVPSANDNAAIAAAFMGQLRAVMSASVMPTWLALMVWQPIGYSIDPSDPVLDLAKP